jgi:hypothetical protein
MENYGYHQERDYRDHEYPFDERLFDGQFRRLSTHARRDVCDVAVAFDPLDHRKKPIRVPNAISFLGD